jgi:uncharacterized membrane protein
MQEQSQIPVGPKNTLTKILAVAGTVLVLFPLIPVLPAITMNLIFNAEFHLGDRAEPAMFLPLLIVGSGLLVWAAQRARARSRLTGWGLGITAVTSVILGIMMGIIVLAPVESGGTLGGIAFLTAITAMYPLMLVVAVIYPLALVVTGVGGILLLRDLFKPLMAQ